MAYGTVGAKAPDHGADRTVVPTSVRRSRTCCYRNETSGHAASWGGDTELLPPSPAGTYSLAVATKDKPSFARWRWLVVAAMGLSLVLLNLLTPDGDGRPSYVVVVTGLAMLAVGLVRASVEYTSRR